ncbi:unnamed protein product [Coccothraustes coccothraustes]
MWNPQVVRAAPSSPPYLPMTRGQSEAPTPPPPADTRQRFRFRPSPPPMGSESPARARITPIRSERACARMRAIALPPKALLLPALPQERGVPSMPCAICIILTG